jgi:DNA-binding beta-propeller fold protein YncE
MRPTIIAAVAALTLGACSDANVAETTTSLQRAAPLSLRSAPVAAHHLYVAAAPYTGSGRLGLERFPIINGKPAQSPDLVYPNNTGPIAVASDGSLYAGSDAGFQTIERFAPGSIKPESRLLAEPCRHKFLYGGLSALTIDAKGNLYVATGEGVSGVRDRAAQHCTDQFVAIYAPNATGRAKPIGLVPVDLGASDPIFSVAIDGSGDLAVDTTSSAVRVYADPTNEPRLVRLFSSRSLPLPQGIAFDASQPVVYIANFSPPSIVVLPADAQGPTQARRVIQGAGAQAYCGQIALLGRFVFVADNTAGAVYEFAKDARGSTKPLATLSLPFPPCGVAVD